MKNSNTKGESLFKRSERYILEYTLKHGTKTYNETLKSDKSIKSIEEAEALAAQFLSQFGDMVTSKTIIHKKESGYILRYEDLDGKTKEKMLYDVNKKPATDKKLAQQLADTFLHEIRKIKDIDSEEELLFKLDRLKKLRQVTHFKISEVWNEFKNTPERREISKNTLACYESYWRVFLRFISTRHTDNDDISCINQNVVKDFFAQLWSDGKSGRTYNAYLQGLSYIMKTVLGSNFEKMNPFEGIRRKPLDTQSKYDFSPDELKRMLNLLQDDNDSYYVFDKPSMRIIVKFMIYTGVRKGDACTFRWENIKKTNDGNYILVFAPNKTRRSSGKTVSVPIHQELLKELFPLMEVPHEKTDYIVPLAAARYKKYPTGISRDGTRLIEAIGLETKEEPGEGVRRCDKRVTRYSMHSFRHTFVSLAANAGIPIEVVRDIVGHTTDSMTRHYTHISDPRKFDAIDSINIPSKDD